MLTDRRELAAIFAGGALGTVLRATLVTVFATDPTRWPWPTFTVNLLGAFLLGYFTTRLLERLPLSNYRRPLVGTGLCGGLTTFSTTRTAQASTSPASRPARSEHRPPDTKWWASVERHPPTMRPPHRRPRRRHRPTNAPERPTWQVPTRSTWRPG